MSDLSQRISDINSGIVLSLHLIMMKQKWKNTNNNKHLWVAIEVELLLPIDYNILL